MASSAEKGFAGLERRVWVVSGVIVLGTVMSILDTTIVNVALDTLAREFHTSLSNIQWVSTGYLLALATSIPVTGWAIDRFGAKRVWMTSIVLFLTGSALSGAAWSIESLIIFRALQGLGGGLLMPVGQTVVAHVAGPRRMGRVMSIIGVPMLLGPVLGPVLGGLLIDDVGWRWIFFVNLPVGAVALVLAWRILRDVRTDEPGRLDVPGLALLSPGLAVLVYGLSRIGSQGGLDGVAAGALGAGVVMLAAFAVHAWGKGERALIDVHLYRERGYTAATVTMFLFGIGMFGALLVLPLYFQAVRGESALTTGILLVPQGIGAAVALPLAGWITDRWGARRVVPFGAALATITTWAFTRFGTHTSFALVDAALFARGFGLGGTMMPTMAAAYQRLAREAVPRATTALNIVQRVGGSIGTAILAVVLERRIAADLGGHGGALGSFGSASPAAQAQIAPELAHAFQQTFWVAFGLVAVTVLASLFLPAAPREDAREPAPSGATTAPPAAPARARSRARGGGAHAPSSRAQRPRR
jgi:EmrB/QacA subfamily drug resistance transporter